jgi:frataxin-like iron-binding protein CyaY
MKKQLVNVLTKISLLSAMVFVTAVVSAQGQSLAYRIRANIPFEFSVADKKLPSGKYSIGRARQESDDTVLSITDADGSSRVIRMSHGVQTLRAKDKPTLVFHRYGDQYFLFQVWPAGESTGRQFYQSHTEREVQRNLAANSASGKVALNEAVETVTIVGVLQ